MPQRCTRLTFFLFLTNTKAGTSWRYRHILPLPGATNRGLSAPYFIFRDMTFSPWNSVCCSLCPLLLDLGSFCSISNPLPGGRRWQIIHQLFPVLWFFRKFLSVELSEKHLKTLYFWLYFRLFCCFYVILIYVILMWSNLCIFCDKMHKINTVLLLFHYLSCIPWVPVFSVTPSSPPAPIWQSLFTQICIFLPPAADPPCSATLPFLAAKLQLQITKKLPQKDKQNLTEFSSVLSPYKHIVFIHISSFFSIYSKRWKNSFIRDDIRFHLCRFPLPTHPLLPSSASSSFLPQGTAWRWRAVVVIC